MAASKDKIMCWTNSNIWCFLCCKDQARWSYSNIKIYIICHSVSVFPHRLSLSPVLQDVIQQRRDGRTLSGGLLIQETPRAVLAHHKLLKQTHRRELAALLCTSFCVKGWIFLLLTCSVLSNQRFPLLENVPPPCRTCAALRLAYLPVKVDKIKSTYCHFLPLYTSTPLRCFD